MEELTEYELVEMALVRMQSNHSLKNILMYYVPLWILTILSSAILYVAYHAQEMTELRPVSANLSAWSSFVMMIIEIVVIAYQHPPPYEWISTLTEFTLRINVLHTIIAASCVAYIKTDGDYSTYFILIYVLTIPILLLSFIPILVRMYGYS
jgi:hypothetical protein